MKKVVLVTKKNKKIGEDTVINAHKGKGKLHRAFTILIFNKRGKILIQKRSKNKLLWPLYWETSCSSHPSPGQKVLESAKKRLKLELGIKCDLKLIDKFYYYSKYKDIGAEKEVCALLIGEYNGRIKLNPKEVLSIKWVDLFKLIENLLKYPKKYAPWLRLAIASYLQYRK